VVQGEKVAGDEDRYSRFTHLGVLEMGALSLTCGVAELRIHEHTERGDNDTVKMPNGQKVVIDGKTCADR
jgi:hypothetical protein